MGDFSATLPTGSIMHVFPLIIMFIGVLFRRENLLATNRHKLVSLIVQKMFERTETNLEANWSPWAR